MDPSSDRVFDEVSYDAEGDPESWLTYGDDGPKSFKRYEKDRDEYGNVLETRVYSSDLMTERYVYEYVFQ